MPRGGSLVIIVLSIALTAHAQEAIAPFVPPNANSVSGNVLRGQLLWGRTDSWPGAPDFFCRQSNSQSNVLHPLADGTPKCYAKGMVLGDIGDSPDLVLRRAGPDGADFNGKPQHVPDRHRAGQPLLAGVGRALRAGAIGFLVGLRRKWPHRADLLAQFRGSDGHVSCRKSASGNDTARRQWESPGPNCHHR